MSNVPPIEVTIAEIGKDIKYIMRRLDENNANVEQLRLQIADHDRHISRLYGGLAIIAFLLPIAIKYWIGG